MPKQLSSVNLSLHPLAVQQAAALQVRQPAVPQGRDKVNSLHASAFIAWLDEVAVEAFRRRMLTGEPLARLTQQAS